MGEDLSGKRLILVNPNAGKGSVEKDWKRISRLLGDSGIPGKPVFTAARNHAIDLTREAIKEGFREIIVVGGDGTLNEAVNGIFLQNACPPAGITLGMIPAGSGNDWGKLYGIPSDYAGAVRVIREGRTCLQDAGLAEYSSGKENRRRYFLNIAGLGFDAAVVERTNRQRDRGRRGKALYLANLLSCLFSYRPVPVELEIDGAMIRREAFTISIGIGRYSGGGMKQTPEALPDDGRFDTTLVNRIGRLDIILSLKMLYDGTILRHPRVENFRGQRIRIRSVLPAFLEVDGESLGHTPVMISIIPRGLKVIYGKLPTQKMD